MAVRSESTDDQWCISEKEKRYFVLYKLVCVNVISGCRYHAFSSKTAACSRNLILVIVGCGGVGAAFLLCLEGSCVVNLYTLMLQCVMLWLLTQDIFIFRHSDEAQVISMSDELVWDRRNEPTDTLWAFIVNVVGYRTLLITLRFSYCVPAFKEFGEMHPRNWNFACYHDRHYFSEQLRHTYPCGVKDVAVGPFFHPSDGLSLTNALRVSS